MQPPARSDQNVRLEVNPVPLPTVLYVAVIPEQSSVILSLRGSPFGASLTTPTIYVSRRERAPIKYALNNQVDMLMLHMLTGNQITGAIITGAKDGDYIILTLGRQLTPAPQTTLYERLTHLTNWLNARSGDIEPGHMDPVAYQMAAATSLDSPDKQPYNTARRMVHGDVRHALVVALNRALANMPADRQGVPDEPRADSDES